MKQLSSIAAMLIGNNDWVALETHTAYWKLVGMEELQDQEINLLPVGLRLPGVRRCAFEIQHSAARDAYRLRVSGHQPKKHSKYRDAVAQLKKYEAATTLTANFQTA